MKGLTLLVAPAVLIVGATLPGLSGAGICIADTNSLDSETVSSATSTGNSSAGPTITIAVTKVFNE